MKLQLFVTCAAYFSMDFCWVSKICFSMFQPFLPNNNTNLSFRSVLGGKPMWITTQQPDHPLKVLLGASLPDSWQGAIGCFQRSRKIQQTGRDAWGKGSNPKLLHSATWWCVWCESIAQQKCAKIQLFRMISVRIWKHDFQYSRYSQQQLTWPSVHCQTNTSPNSCAVSWFQPSSGDLNAMILSVQEWSQGLALLMTCRSLALEVAESKARNALLNSCTLVFLWARFWSEIPLVGTEGMKLLYVVMIRDLFPHYVCQFLKEIMLQSFLSSDDIEFANSVTSWWWLDFQS